MNCEFLIENIEFLIENFSCSARFDPPKSSTPFGQATPQVRGTKK